MLSSSPHANNVAQAARKLPLGSGSPAENHEKNGGFSMNIWWLNMNETINKGNQLEGTWPIFDTLQTNDS